MGFAAEQLARTRADWQKMVGHPFLLSTRDGTIPFETFATWMRQDYLFVEATSRSSPSCSRRRPRSTGPRTRACSACCRRSSSSFASARPRWASTSSNLAPAFVNHAYIQFLLATAYRDSYACGYTVLYAAEKAYHDSWREVLSGIDRASPWFPFVENWGGAAFAGYVAHLEEELDDLAAQAGAAERRRMAELFELTLRYEIAFWEMAWSGEGWPSQT